MSVIHCRSVNSSAALAGVVIEAIDADKDASRIKSLTDNTFFMIKVGFAKGSTSIFSYYCVLDCMKSTILSIVS